MADDLATWLDQTRAALGGAMGADWEDGILKAALRLALGEYSIASGQTVTLAGLDGAPETTLPLADRSLVMLGVLGYAAMTRSAAKLAIPLANEPEDTSGGNPPLTAWGKEVLAAFRSGMAAIFAIRMERARLAELRESQTQPWETAFPLPDW